MKKHLIHILLASIPLTAIAVTQAGPKAGEAGPPLPTVVAAQYDGKPVTAPHGAMILLGGKDVSAWLQLPSKDKPNQPAEPVLWKIEDDHLEVVPRSGMICTRDKAITSGHLHIEWATPAIVKGDGQGRGNSGIMIEGMPEIQVLDSFNNTTYPDGQAAAFYKKHPPLVNASRGPGLWQSYDIHIQRAKVVSGKITEPATVTAYHNNVLVQDRVEFANPLQAGTLRLQDHLNPVRFRNIWFLPKPDHRSTDSTTKP